MSEEMTKVGWREVAIDGEGYIQRMVETYRELDFDVYLEEVSPGECGRCTICYEASNEKIYRLYVRREQELSE